MNETILAGVTVRRFNGQCEYGPWLPLTDDLPSWVADGVANQIAYDDLDEGTVEQAGAMFRWRK